MSKCKKKQLFKQLYQVQNNMVDKTRIVCFICSKQANLNFIFLSFLHYSQRQITKFKRLTLLEPDFNLQGMHYDRTLHGESLRVSDKFDFPYQILWSVPFFGCELLTHQKLLEKAMPALQFFISTKV